MPLRCWWQRPGSMRRFAVNRHCDVKRKWHPIVKNTSLAGTTPAWVWTMATDDCPRSCVETTKAHTTRKLLRIARLFKALICSASASTRRLSSVTLPHCLERPRGGQHPEHSCDPLSLLFTSSRKWRTFSRLWKRNGPTRKALKRSSLTYLSAPLPIVRIMARSKMNWKWPPEPVIRTQPIATKRTTESHCNRWIQTLKTLNSWWMVSMRSKTCAATLISSKPRSCHYITSLMTPRSQKYGSMIYGPCFGSVILFIRLPATRPQGVTMSSGEFIGSRVPGPTVSACSKYLSLALYNTNDGC